VVESNSILLGLSFFDGGAAIRDEEGNNNLPGFDIELELEFIDV
jgi:hypothetical protein